MINPVVWFEIYADDLARAKTFYEKVLDAELKPLSAPMEGNIEMLSFPASQTGYGATGALVKMEGFSPGAGGTIVYFACEDCAVETSRVAAAGGQVMQGKMAIGEHGFCALAMDTEGNMFGLHSGK